MSACATARAQTDAGTLHAPPPAAADAAAREVPPPADGRPPATDGRSDAPPSPDARPEAPADPITAAARRAEAAARSGDIAGAIAALGDYAAAPGIGEHEKAYARSRADELASRLGPQAIPIWATASSDFVRAAVGPRAAMALRARSEGEAARKVDEQANALRASLGWTVTASWLGSGDPRRIGLAVPLSGRSAFAGDVALRAAMMALGDLAAQPAPGNPVFELVVRDSAPEREAGANAALELIREEAAIALVGGIEGPALPQATQDGVPYLALSDRAPGASTTAFQVFHGAEARAAQLARQALALGLKQFAVLGPDSSSGKRLADAFAATVTAGGGRVAAQATYVAGATSFGPPIKQLKRAAWEAIFIPEDAGRLELIAPALAADDLWPQPLAALSVAGERGTPRGAPRRNIVLLSTALGLSDKLLKNAGRFVQGALLAPGFFPDPDDARAANFVSHFRTLYGEEPHAVDAYTYDAVRALAGAVERGARSRAEVLKSLASDGFEGVTGTLRFGPDHARLDPPAVYYVDGQAIRRMR